MRRAVVVGALPLLMAAVVLPATGSGAATSKPASIGGLLDAVTAVSADDVWAVGSAADRTSLVEHWDGTSWLRVASPTLGRETDLNSVSAVSADDVWAVGTWFTGRHYFAQPIVLHWDGSAWTQMPFVATPFPTRLHGVAAISATEVWAVGSIQAHSFAVRWDGSAWVGGKVKHRESELGTNGLAAVDALSPDDMWVVGSRRPGSDQLTPMAQTRTGDHWDLTTPAIPEHGTYSAFNGVAAVTPSLSWAVGEASDVTGGYGLIERWDGSAWSVSRVRGLPWAGSDVRPSIAAEFEDVDAASADDAWAVGDVGRLATSPLLAHWNGDWWRRTPVPRVDGARLRGYLGGIAAPSQDDAWAVGWNPTADGITAIILQWNGSQWSVVAS